MSWETYSQDLKNTILRLGDDLTDHHLDGARVPIAAEKEERASSSADFPVAAMGSRELMALINNAILSNERGRSPERNHVPHDPQRFDIGDEGETEEYDDEEYEGYWEATREFLEQNEGGDGNKTNPSGVGNDSAVPELP
eukprot:15749957-Heterocapsa_arctica.AAC.1